MFQSLVHPIATAPSGARRSKPIAHPRATGSIPAVIANAVKK